MADIENFFVFGSLFKDRDGEWGVVTDFEMVKRKKSPKNEGDFKKCDIEQWFFFVEVGGDGWEWGVRPKKKENKQINKERKSNKQVMIQYTELSSSLITIGLYFFFNNIFFL